MKRLVIITVGKTHSGKTTFARALEKTLRNSLVMDQDNHATFINTYYKSLQPKQGPNTLKHAISQLIVNYAVETTDHHLIICNSNRSKQGRKFLLEELFPSEKFIRILVHFDIPDSILQSRVIHSERSTIIFRGASFFEEVLVRQQEDSLKEDVADPTEEEAYHLYVIKDNQEIEAIIDRIVSIAEGL
ncbi:AAA family ATPase [Ornithinibacillus xuwenensis]|uniref:AAA family ATPase n=1 Tax=Ornithinibacillus xuwenensis TaxID=3144668 RepID=A0ABU9XKJ2_9BACI